jgi:hypothetical protein
MISTILKILIGLVLLLAGRKFFWLFIGVVGFLAGFALATQFLQDWSSEAVLVFAIVCGVIGVAAALFLQRFAVLAAGFAAGGYLSYVLMNSIAMDNIWIWLVVFVVLGVICAGLMSLVFNAALVILSSLTGALLVSQTIPLDSTVPTLAFLVLAGIGIVVQFGFTRRRHAS